MSRLITIQGTPNLKFVALLFTVAAAFLTAQIEIRPFNNFPNNEDASLGSVYSIMQDKQGFIWLGTDNGLIYYDGVRFKAWKESLLSGIRIRLIESDGKGGMWLGSDQGLIHIDEKRTIASWRQTLPGYKEEEVSFILSMKLTNNGNLWIGTRKGLCLLDATSGEVNRVEYLTDETVKTGLARVHAIEIEGPNLWLGTGFGLLHLKAKNGQFTSQLLKERNSATPYHNEIRALKKDASGNLWIGTINGLITYNHASDSFLRFPDLFNDISRKIWVNTIKLGPDGHIWIGTRKNGLWAVDARGNLIRRFNGSQTHGNLISNNVLAVAFGNPKILWVGAFKNGASMYDLKPRRFKSFLLQRTEKQVSDHVRCIYEDSAGRLWIGNRNGLILYNPENNKITHFNHDPTDVGSLATDSVISIGEDGMGRIWVGTFNGGANVYDPKGNTFIHHQHDPKDPNSLGYNYVQSIEPDNTNKLWIGTWRGIYYYDAETGIFTEQKVSLGNMLKPWVYAIKKLGNGEIWVASGVGLLRLDKHRNHWKAYQHEPGNDRTISDNQPTSILEDSRGRVWVGTHNGLNLWIPDEDRFQVFAENEGLPGASIRSMVEGANGEIWLGTNSGLARFNPEGGLRVFDMHDGLRSSEFYLGASFKNKKTGEIFFGGPKGYNSFFPSQMQENETIPPIAITSISIFNQEAPFWDMVDEDGVITLKPDQNFFSLEFAVMDFTAPPKNKYAYKLDGIDADWVSPESAPYAAYSNLDAGEYLFQVKGSNNDNIWNETGAQVKIRILPHFWQRGLFQFGSLIILVCLILACHQYLIKGAKRRSGELILEADNRGEALQDLHQQLLEEARKAGIAEITTGVLHNIGNILNSISTSAHALIATLNQSKLDKLKKGNELLASIDSLSDYLAHNPKGLMLPEYYGKIVEALGEEYCLYKSESSHMRDKLDFMSKAVVVEQSHNQPPSENQKVDLISMVEDAIKLQEISLKKRDIEIQREFVQTPPCHTDSFKLLHVLINLIRNAVDALVLAPPNTHRILKISVGPLDPNYNEIRIRDNGCGISREKLPEIFSYGFTTKETGNGFGLHTCKMAMDEIGGSITVGSRGRNQGAVFILKVPLNHEDGDG